MSSSKYIFFTILILSLASVGWVMFDPNSCETFIDNISHHISLKIKDENNNGTFQHNFCESRLQNNQGPELWNAWTSLIISVVPFIYGFPKYPLLYNVACMLSVNGVASFHYHYNLTWLGKQADEISMILANYFGLWGLINIYYKKSERRNNYNRYNTTFMYLFLVGNTLIEYDVLFPTIFGVYIGGTLVMIYYVAKMHKVPYMRNLMISSVGAVSWIISEHYCNVYTKYGHPLWHLLFPLGFYRLILDYDKIKYPLIENSEIHDVNL